jgi:hypothetical protein
VRGLGSTFRRFRAGGMSSFALSCDGGGVRDRQVGGRIGEFGGELSGELGIELRGEEMSEAALKYMSSWERAGRYCSGRCIRELGIVFQAIVLNLMSCKVRVGERGHFMTSSIKKVCDRRLSPAQGVKEK